MSALASILALALAGAASRDPAGPAAPAAEPPDVPAGSQAAPLDEGATPWRLALSTGVAGRLGGRRLSAREENPRVLLFFSGQADGSWPEGHGQAARLRFRLFTGGESGIYVPSDGEVEVAYLVGRPAFRFVLARVELARQPGIALQTLAQAGTLPSFEGSFFVAGDTMQLAYFVSPVEAAWVRYHGGAHLEHLPGWTTEDDRPSAASAGRVRWTMFLEPALAVSVEGELAKFWGAADLLLAAEGAVGYQLPRQQAAFHAGVRWSSYTRRGLARDTRETDAEVVLLAAASLAF